MAESRVYPVAWAAVRSGLADGGLHGHALGRRRRHLWSGIHGGLGSRRPAILGHDLRLAFGLLGGGLDFLLRQHLRIVAMPAPRARHGNDRRTFIEGLLVLR